MRLLLDPRTGSPLTDEQVDGWRLQRRRSEQGGGRPEIVRDQDGAPLLLPADAEEDDCHEWRREGWPHLVALGIRHGRQVVTRAVPPPSDDAGPSVEEEGEEEQLAGGELESACAEMMRANADAMRQVSAAAVAQMKAVTETSMDMVNAIAELVGRSVSGKGEGEEKSTEDRLVALGETFARIKGAETAARLTTPQLQPPAPPQSAPLPPPPAPNGANGTHKHKGANSAPKRK